MFTEENLVNKRSVVEKCFGINKIIIIINWAEIFFTIHTQSSGQ
jgi:hypothetical protein